VRERERERECKSENEREVVAAVYGQEGVEDEATDRCICTGETMMKAMKDAGLA